MVKRLAQSSTLSPSVLKNNLNSFKFFSYLNRSVLRIAVHNQNVMITQMLQLPNYLCDGILFVTSRDNHRDIRVTRLLQPSDLQTILGACARVFSLNMEAPFILSHANFSFRFT